MRIWAGALFVLAALVAAAPLALADDAAAPPPVVASTPAPRVVVAAPAPAPAPLAVPHGQREYRTGPCDRCQGWYPYYRCRCAPAGATCRPYAWTTRYYVRPCYRTSWYGPACYGRPFPSRR